MALEGLFTFNQLDIQLCGSAGLSLHRLTSACDIAGNIVAAKYALAGNSRDGGRGKKKAISCVADVNDVEPYTALFISSVPNLALKLLGAICFASFGSGGPNRFFK